MTLRQLAAILACSLALAAGCGHETGPPPAPIQPELPPATVMPPAVTSQMGEGPIAVFGASVYSPGQEIYKVLRQEDSLMAFLACQGEPDRLEVRENEDPDALPRIILEYTRRTLPQHGTVAIEPTASGYYAAHPIDPNGRLKSAKSTEPVHPSQPAPKPKQTTPAKAKQPARESEPEPAPPKEPIEPAEAAPAPPQPTAAQQDECPIEPWRADCRNLCVAGASWEWCSYRD